MNFLAVAGLIALAEMATFFWVGSQIGFGWAFGIAITTAVIGSYLVRRAGISVFAQAQRKFGQGQIPGRELVEGAAILVAGAFLISPGFITDVLGFLLLIPAMRALVYYPIARRFSNRVTVIAGTRTFPRGAGDVIDVDEVSKEPGQLP